MRPRSIRVFVASATVVAFAFGAWRLHLRPVEVKAFDETTPVQETGDAADDPAIWVDPIDPENSLVLGTDKKGGLAVYDLQGRLVRFVEQPGLNNVDVRDAFDLGGEPVTLVMASDGVTKSLRFYRLDPDARTVEPIPGGVVPLTVEGMGACLFHDRVLQRFYAFGVGRDERGASYAEQFLLDGHTGTIQATAVRRVHIGRRAEGCVVDDVERSLFVAEERGGIWRLSASADGGDAKELVLPHGRWNGVITDIEGLALVNGPNSERLLLASHQGRDEFLVLDRDDDYAIIGRFTVVDSKRTDAVSHTDGIDVVSTALGDRFPGGLLVVQDGHNRLEPQNFKYVRWDSILTAIGLTRRAGPGR